jgi:hypothetical protein
MRSTRCPGPVTPGHRVERTRSGFEPLGCALQRPGDRERLIPGQNQVEGRELAVAGLVAEVHASW